ncbi:MAG: TIGR03546 family protein [Planctomycetaceae bacterium]|jgi:uncharacterized protein (TIGR03546 family)|nr:TIGR03546 family protein [Planctomycetaceae bacterium]
MLLLFLWLIIGGIVTLVLPERKPRQIALAVALGAMTGLLQKDNLLVLLLILAIFLLRVNLGAGILAAVIFSGLGTLLDSFADKIGSWILCRPVIQPLGTSFFELPLTAWTSLNNTVVLGNFVIGLVLFYPVFHISLRICRKITDRHAAGTDSNASGANISDGTTRIPHSESESDTGSNVCGSGFAGEIGSGTASVPGIPEKPSALESFLVPSDGEELRGNPGGM